jgi:hypothetical protein
MDRESLSVEKYLSRYLMEMREQALKIFDGGDHSRER